MLIDSITLIAHFTTLYESQVSVFYVQCVEISITDERTMHGSACVPKPPCLVGWTPASFCKA